MTPAWNSSAWQGAAWQGIAAVGAAPTEDATDAIDTFTLLVVGTKTKLDVAQAITGGELERTIEGASSLKIDLFDPHRALLRSGAFARAVDVEFAGCWYRLAAVSKAGDTISLTFEDRDVAYLREHTKPRKVSRNKMTRAQFVRSLVVEVKANDIEFFCPEEKLVQNIGKSKKDKD